MKTRLEQAAERVLDLVLDDPLIERLTDDVARNLCGRERLINNPIDPSDDAWEDPEWLRAKAIARNIILDYTAGMAQ